MFKIPLRSSIELKATSITTRVVNMVMHLLDSPSMKDLLHYVLEVLSIDNL